MQRLEVRDQIAFYKQVRKVMQFGTFWRGEPEKPNKAVWHCVSPAGDLAISGFYQTQTSASEGFDRLRVPGLRELRRYRVSTHPQRVFIRRFGGLIHHVLPLRLHPEGYLLGLLNRRYALFDGCETYDATGQTLASGVLLQNQFLGSGYSKDIRLLGDFGSTLYVTQALEQSETISAGA